MLQASTIPSANSLTLFFIHTLNVVIDTIFSMLQASTIPNANSLTYNQAAHIICYGHDVRQQSIIICVLGVSSVACTLWRMAG